jgi:hypothetical protein
MAGQEPDVDDQIAKRNLTHLADRYPSISATLLAFRKETRTKRTEPRYVVVPSATGKPTCRDTKAPREEWVHDPNDPVSEAAAAVKSINLTGQPLLLMFRAGLGYLAMELARRLRDASSPIRVLIYEDRW